MANIVGHLRHVATTAHEQGRSRQLRHAPCSLSAPPLLNLRTFHSALRLLLLSYTLSMLLLSIPQSFAAPLAWQQLSPADPTAPKPSPRRGGALAFDPLGQQLIAFGGIGVEGILQDTWLYDITARSWRQLQHPEGSPVPEPRHTFTFGLYIAQVNATSSEAGASSSLVSPIPSSRRSFLIVSTGQGAGRVLSDTWALDVSGGTWRRLPDNGDAPQPRYGSAGGIGIASAYAQDPGDANSTTTANGTTTSNRFWLSHGFASKRYSDTRYYDLVLEQWVLVHDNVNPYNPAAPHSRCIVSSAVTPAEDLVMYGGCAQNGGTGGPCPGRDAWVYGGGLEGYGKYGSWKEKSTCPSPRTRGGMASLNSREDSISAQGSGGRYVLLYGGYEEDKQTISVSHAPDDQLPVLDLRTGLWRMLRAAGDVPIFRGGPAVAHDPATGRVYVFGGQLRASGQLTNELFVLEGDPADTPVHAHGCASSFLFPHLHGIFMGLAWGVLLQAGWFIARYFKRPGSPTWFHLHRGCQVAGLLLAVVGLAVVLAGGVKGSNLGFSHGVIGLLATGLGLLQPMNAFFRPHHGEKYRTQWEWLHVSSGRVAVVLGAANVSLGTFLIQGPYAVWITWHVMLGVFVITVVIMEVRHQRAIRESERVKMAGEAEGSSEHEAKQVEALWAPGGQEKGGVVVRTM